MEQQLYLKTRIEKGYSLTDIQFAACSLELQEVYIDKGNYLTDVQFKKYFNL